MPIAIGNVESLTRRLAPIQSVISRCQISPGLAFKFASVATIEIKKRPFPSYAIPDTNRVVRAYLVPREQ